MKLLTPVPCLTDPDGQQHELARDLVTIGRAIENDIVVTSKRVSREHARIRREAVGCCWKTWAAPTAHS
jgi:hypothetical protein